MRVLVSNDDGISAVGLRALVPALIEAGHEVRIVAPSRQQSGVSHCLTYLRPLQGREVVTEGGIAGLAVDGSPADCVKLGLYLYGDNPPDLVISGINAGANVGPDILYSGTIAAATEGCLAGIPSVAVSDQSFSPVDLDAKARHAVSLIGRIDWSSLFPRRVVNINYPDGQLEDAKGLRVCPQTSAVWTNSYASRINPRGDTYWWLTGEVPDKDVEPETDRHFLDRGYITVTPLRFDSTDDAGIFALADLEKPEQDSSKTNKL